MKRIVIIGGTSGIGRELALLYAGGGHLVGVTGRRKPLLEALRTAFPENISTAAFDITAAGSATHLSQLIAGLGGMDLFIFNAGTGDASKEYDAARDIHTTRTNVMGAVELVSTAYQYFLEKGTGQIAITSSVAGLRGNSWAPAYSASKAFLSNYAEGLNMKAGRLGKDIVVTDIRPGFVDTNSAQANKRFWVASPRKVAKQISKAIEKRKHVVYVTKRWWLVAQVMKIVPYSFYRRLV